MNARTSVVTLSRAAMATRFELVLCGDDESRLRAAGEEALNEIERLDDQLSAYRPESEVSDINRRAGREPVRVEPRLFRLLQTAREIHDRTDGAFDITIAPLMRVWGFSNYTQARHSERSDNGESPVFRDLSEAEIPKQNAFLETKPPDRHSERSDSGVEESAFLSLIPPDQLDTARQLVGMNHIILNESDFTVRFDREGVSIDLGAIGKGYAVQRAADILRDIGITSALIHGGTSSIYAIGAPPDGPDWRTAIRHPGDPEKILETVGLRDSSLSVSAVHGKSFIYRDTEYGHVIDPRTGYPSQDAVLAAIVCPDATEGDALSTALLVLGSEWLERLVDAKRATSGLIVQKDSAGGFAVIKRSFSVGEVK